MMKVQLNRKRGEWGQSLLEFALVMPVLMMLFMGIFDFGRAFFIYSQISNGAREAARYGSLSGLDPGNPQYLDCMGMYEQGVETFGLRHDIQMLIEWDTGDETEPITDDKGNKFNCQVTDGQLDKKSNEPSDPYIIRGDRVRVTVTSHFEFLTPGVNIIAPDGLELKFTAARSILKGGTRIPND